jgi:creatinine amidohydrolase
MDERRLSAGAPPRATEAPRAEKVRYLELLPHELRARLAARPIGYLPMGTLEWHGEHSALGADALISEGVFVRAAQQLGGIVFPPLFVGPSRLPPPHHDEDCFWISTGLFLQLVEGVLEQARRVGFKVVVADGHGPSRRSIMPYAEAWSQRFGVQLVVPLWNVTPWTSQIDHAGKNETSLMMALHRRLVDLSLLPSSPAPLPKGISGDDPRDSSAEIGEQYIAESLESLERTLRSLGSLGD